jgi:putative ABC transport system permease protein
MNIINKLTLRHLKLNKQRTVVTIIGVILSVSMLTAVPTFVSSFLNMMQRSVIADTGNWHVLYNNVPRQNIDVVMNDKNTAAAALSQDIGYALLDGAKNEDKPYLFLKSYDEQGFATFNLKLVEGRFPKKSSEIVISSRIAENGGVIYKVGDTIHLDVGQRHLEKGGNNLVLGQDYGFVKQSADETGERFIPEYAQEYTVTGIISPPNFEQYWAPGYTVISYLDKNELASGETVNISVAWQNVNKQANIHANELAENVGVSSDSVSYNRALLRYYGIIDDNLLSTLYALAAFIIVLIIIGSVALIYNSFAISISERSRHLGMLASVGATKKQKRNSVFFEGLVVGIIGIPLGVFFGTLGMGITFVLVQPLLTDVFKVNLTLVVSPEAILTAVLLSMLTIFISAYIPARRASRISPIDAIRQSQDVKLTGRTVKTSTLTRLIFGFEAELGLKNLKRHSRRYKVTIFSLVISIVLFLSVSSLSMLSQKSAELAAGSIPYDIKVFVTSSATAQEKKEFYTAITRMDYVDESVIEQQNMEAVATVGGDLMAAARNTNVQPGNQEQAAETFAMQFQIKSIDDAALNKYAKENGMDVLRLKDTKNPGGILFNTVTIKTPDKKYMRMNRFNIEAGESLQFIHQINGEPSDYSTELQIIALADTTPIGETSLIDPNQAMLFVSEEVYAIMQAKLPEEFDNTYVDMLIKSSDPISLVEGIKEYQKQTSIANLHIYDAAAAYKRNLQVNTFIGVFFYGFVLLMAAICVANILNTISTSVLLRRREFAVLKSIGMTPQGFNKMIKYESLFYGIKALLYGLPISFVMMYLIYRILSNSFAFAFIIPWASVIVAIIAILAMVSTTMLYASSKIKKENIIDVLKNENI